MLKKLRRRFILSAMVAMAAVMLLLIAGINIGNFVSTTGQLDQQIDIVFRFEGAGMPDEQPLENTSQTEDGFSAEDMVQTEVRSPAEDTVQTEGTSLTEDISQTEGESSGEEAFQTEAGSSGEDTAQTEGAFSAEGASSMDGAFPAATGIPWTGSPIEEMIRFFAVRCDKDGEILSISSDKISTIDEETIAAYTKDVLARGKTKAYYGDYRYEIRENDDGERIVVFMNAAMERKFVFSLLMVSGLVVLLALLAAFVLITIFSSRAIRPYAESIARQKRFITDAGHELKTPLASIAASAEVAVMEHGEDEWILNIQKQTERMSHLVGDLVTLSRFDEETPFLEKEWFSLSDAAWEIAEPFVSRAKARGKKLTVHIQDDLSLYGDQTSIGQMISILLDNAVRYSDEKGQISLDVYRRHGQIRIEVFNSCDLKNVSDLNRLFDRFYRPDESRSANTGGTGIGLSMAKAAAEAHGGKITVKSPSGKTILFRVSF